MPIREHTAMRDLYVEDTSVADILNCNCIRRKCL